jgi:hypothetical protein
MTQDAQSVREDLAFIKTLAQEGRRAPLMSGRFLLSAGLVYGVTSLVAWAITIRLIDVPLDWLAGLWLGVTIVFVPSTRLLGRFVVNRPGLTAANNRAAFAVWQGLGFALTSMLVAACAISAIVKTPIVFAVFPSIVLAVYGMAWWLAAAVSDLNWLRWTALGCFVSAVLIALLIESTAIYLAYAAALFAFLALPGWLLMRAEPAALVDAHPATLA